MRHRLVSTCILMLALVGCSNVIQLQPDARIPAARGKIEVATGPNGNAKLKVFVRFLAEPFRVRPGSSSYVVWVQPNAAGSAPQNIGALRIDKDLSGALQTVTPLRAFALFLTCENSPLVQTPTGDAMMSTAVGRR